MIQVQHLPAITLWQPWAGAIAYGPKRIENRAWAPPAELLGQWVAIHAGASLDPEMVRALAACRENGYDPDSHANGWARGAVLAVARIERVTRSSTNPWFSRRPGNIGWVFSEVRALQVPIPCSGGQRIWRLPEHARIQAMSHLNVALRGGR